MLNVAVLLALGVLPLSIADASVPRADAVSPLGESALASASHDVGSLRSLTASLAAPASSEGDFALFAGDELVLASRTRDPGFHPLQGFALLEMEPLRGPPLGLLETRIGGSGLFLGSRIGERERLSLDAQWGCGLWGGEHAADQPQDPLGLAGDISFGRQYEEMRRHGASPEIIDAQRAADQAAIETGVKVDLTLAALAVPIARVWQVVRTLPEIWSLGASAWLYRNAPAVQRATEEVVEAANEGPSIVPHQPGSKALPPVSPKLEEARPITNPRRLLPAVQPGSRPTARQSELDVVAEYGWPAQQSWAGGRPTRYGAKDSVRPDLSHPSSLLHLDVKNYDLSSSANRANLYREIRRQASQRGLDLPGGSHQGIVLDIRGQSVDPAVLARIPLNIEQVTGGVIPRTSVVFKRD